MAGPDQNGARGHTSAYLEFQTVGHIVKVSAIDPVTGTEVSTFGPVGASRADLETLALAKLRHRLERAAAAAAAPKPMPGPAAARPMSRVNTRIA